jgi:hypothetical protein
MAINIQENRPFPESVQRDIGAVIKNADKLVDILEESTDQQPGFSPASLFATISDKLGLTFPEVSRAFSAIENLSSLRSESVGTDAVIALIQRRVNKELVEALVKNKDNLKRVIELYSQSHPVAISIKAEKLSYLHERLYQDAEIITDIRPIFNADGTVVVEMVVTNSLVLSFYTYGSGTERMHFAMDASDVRRLTSICERAARKADALKTTFGGMPWPLKILNDSDDNG